MILANKYRPKKLDDIIGQEVPVRIIRNSFLNNNLHHFYIFDSSSPGVSKTTLARVMAMMENCNNLKNKIDPCGECSICKSIYSGKSSDIIELDAAKNRSVDDIRKISEAIAHGPLECKTRYVIIDEAHSLTGIAADATLKMTEEPPKNTRFIFCTTKKEKMIDTTISRSIDLSFSRISVKDISDNLKKICLLESISIDEESAHLIARKSKGSIRNSISYLEKVNQYCNYNILIEEAKRVFNDLDDDVFYEIIDGVINKNPKKCIEIIKKSSNSNNSEKILEGLEEYLNKVLIVKICKNSSNELLELTQDEIVKIQHQATNIKPVVLSKIHGLLVEVRRGAMLNMDLSFLLERWCLDACVEYVRLTKSS